MIPNIENHQFLRIARLKQYQKGIHTLLNMLFNKLGFFPSRDSFMRQQLQKHAAPIEETTTM